MLRLLEDMARPHPGHARLVLSNRPEAGGLVRAQAMGVATEVLDHRTFGEDRASFETELHKILMAYKIDVICLQGSCEFWARSLSALGGGGCSIFILRFCQSIRGSTPINAPWRPVTRLRDALCMRLCHNWMLARFWGKVRCPSCPVIRRKILQIVFWSKSTFSIQRSCGLS